MCHTGDGGSSLGIRKKKSDPDRPLLFPAPPLFPLKNYQEFKGLKCLSAEGTSYDGLRQCFPGWDKRTQGREGGRGEVRDKTFRDTGEEVG